MTHDEAVAGAVAWAAEVLAPDILGTYDFMTDSKTEALPDAMGEVNDSYVAFRDPKFPVGDIQQGPLHVFDLTLSFMVDDRDPQAASRLLRGFADRLGVDLLSSTTMRGRVMFVSPQHRFDFARPFVEYADGTRGREMTLDISVAEIVEV